MQSVDAVVVRTEVVGVKIGSHSIRYSQDLLCLLHGEARSPLPKQSPLPDLPNGMNPMHGILFARRRQHRDAEEIRLPSTLIFHISYQRPY